ncbi:rho GTPase-activating protein 23-like [Schistocerca gregaria]|uniref:rho GTPase-activating protein 23-like n=1 Tax=Schistocerca gregaria TaxID=7010 RepID=UPI00211DFB45|nr:rho GTPase-activating protein 23-like [Schistocerca gregaria]
MRELESSHLDVKGIFRISPLKHQLDEVKSRLDQGEKIEWKKQDVHTCTGVVKSFLRELPECLSGKKVYAKLLKIGDMEGGESMKSALKEAIDQVPMPNYVLLKRVIRLCYLIDKNREKNMMSAQNLAVVLGPSLLFSPGTAVEEMLQCVRKVNKVVQSMIVNFEEVFTRDEEGDGQRNRSASSGKSAGLSKMLRPPFLRSSSRRLQRLMSNLSPTGQNAEPTNPSNSSNSSSPVEEDDVFARFSKLAEEEAKSRVRVVQSPIKSDEKNLSLGEATKELLFKSSYVQDPENMMFIMNKMLFAVNERVDSEGRLVMAVQSFINQVCKFTSLALAVLCGVDGQLPNLILYLKSTAVSMKSILVLLRKDEMRIDHLQKKTLIHLSSLLHYKTIELASVVKKVEGNQDDTSLYKLSRLTEEYMEICNRFYSFVRLIPSNQKLKEDSKKLILCVKQILLASTHAVPQKVMEIFNDYKIFNSDFVTDVEAIISRHLAEQNNVLTQVV